MVITNRKIAGIRFVRLLVRACKEGVKCIQIREKDLSANELLNLSRRLKKAASKSHTKIIINERLDIALLSKADGVHSASNGIAAAYIRKLDPKLIAGRSVHSLNEARGAEKDGFDYLLFGPVFRTPAKMKFGKPQGLKKLKEVCKSVNIPVFAVGGITPRRAERCISAGAYGVAAIRPFMTLINLKVTVKEFRNSLGSL